MLFSLHIPQPVLKWQDDGRATQFKLKLNIFHHFYWFPLHDLINNYLRISMRTTIKRFASHDVWTVSNPFFMCASVMWACPGCASLLTHPTEHFTNFKLDNPSSNVSDLHKIRISRLSNCEILNQAARNWQAVQSVKKQFQDWATSARVFFSLALSGQFQSSARIKLTDS